MKKKNEEKNSQVKFSLSNDMKVNININQTILHDRRSISLTNKKENVILSLRQSRCLSRSIRPEVFCKKGVLRDFAKFPGKHLCQSLFFNKAAGLRPVTVLKRDSDTGFFL